MNWTVDPDAVIGERSLSFVAAARISLDPIAAAVRAGVEARLVPLWYSQQIPDLYCRNFVVAAESTMPEAITELSHNAWGPQLLAPTERFAWEMIPRWIWRSHARLTAKHDGMPEVLDVPEPPWSDPLVLEVSEWWARRQTEAFEAELREMALTFENKLEQLGLELTARAARRGLGPAVLERVAFTVRREGLAQEDVYDTLRECEQVMQAALRTDPGTGPFQRSASPCHRAGTRPDNTHAQNSVPMMSLSDRVDHIQPEAKKIALNAQGAADAAGARASGSSLGSDMTTRPMSSDVMRQLARERLEALRAATPEGPPGRAEPRPGGPRRVHEAPAGLRDLHVELSALEILRRGEASVDMGWPADSPPGSAQRKFEAAADDEATAARSLLWAASGWLEVDQVLDLAALAAAKIGWSHVPARELFSELLARPGPEPGDDQPGPQRPDEPD